MLRRVSDPLAGANKIPTINPAVKPANNLFIAIIFSERIAGFLLLYVLKYHATDASFHKSFILSIMTDVYYMTLALKEARRAFEEEEIPVGAIVVQNGRIISRGYNMTERLNDPTAHAEIIALTSARSEEHTSELQSR